MSTKYFAQCIHRKFLLLLEHFLQLLYVVNTRLKIELELNIEDKGKKIMFSEQGRYLLCRD